MSLNLKTVLVALSFLLAGKVLTAQITSLEPLQLYLADYPDSLDGYETQNPVLEYSPSFRMHSVLNDHWSWFVQVGLSGATQRMQRLNPRFPTDPFYFEYTTYSRLDMVTRVGGELWTSTAGEDLLVFRQSLSVGLHLRLTETEIGLLNTGHPGMNTRSTIALRLGDRSYLSYFINYGFKLNNGDYIGRLGVGLGLEYYL